MFAPTFLGDSSRLCLSYLALWGSFPSVVSCASISPAVCSFTQHYAISAPHMGTHRTVTVIEIVISHDSPGR